MLALRGASGSKGEGQGVRRGTAVIPASESGTAADTQTHGCMRAQECVLDDFKTLMGTADAKLTTEHLDRLANACLVVDALGPRVSLEVAGPACHSMARGPRCVRACPPTRVHTQWHAPPSPQAAGALARSRSPPSPGLTRSACVAACAVRRNVGLQRTSSSDNATGHPPSRRSTATRRVCGAAGARKGPGLVGLDLDGTTHTCPVRSPAAWLHPLT